MTNLQKISGLPIEPADDFHLKFNPPLKDFPITIGRKFSEMQPLLFDRGAKPELEVLYNVYRGIHLPQHEQLVKENHLTYDLTILPPVMLGQEFNKTFGHYHANIPGLQISHPELYEVLHGQGLFILQKMDQAFEKLLDVIVVLAKAGDKIIYPPNYGHNFVNTRTEPFVTANWLSTDYQPLYEPVSKYRGMAYYVIKGKDGQPELVPNQNYNLVKAARKINTQAYQEFPIMRSGPMYILGMNDPTTLEFLNAPQKYLAQLGKLV